MFATLLSRSCVIVAVAFTASVASAEVIEEIVAWVGGDIITKSDLEEEERLITEDLYRSYTGDELDRQLEVARAQLLDQMIDRKILLHRAERLFDLGALGDGLIEDFMARNNIDTEEQLDQVLAGQGMDRDSLRSRLIENLAPAEIVKIEVSNRLSVSDSELEAYYRDHPEEFVVPARFTLKEIVLLVDESNKQEKLKQAQAIRAKASDPSADFEALAKQYSEAGTASSGGTIGPVGRGDLNPDLEALALSLPIGEVSEVIEMPYGYHIVRVESRTQESTVSLEDIRTELRVELENRKYVEQLQAYLEKARDEEEWRVNEKYEDRLLKQ